MKAESKSNKRGFSLFETVIALTLIGIVFAAATTAVITSVNVRRRNADSKYFITETSNYLECYKIGGSATFADNVGKYLVSDCLEKQDLESSTSHSVYYVCYNVYYSAGYKRLSPEEKDNACFVMKITLDKSFTVRVNEIRSGKKVYELKNPYVSHFDLVP